MFAFLKNAALSNSTFRRIQDRQLTTPENSIDDDMKFTPIKNLIDMDS